IPALVMYFAGRFAQKMGRKAPSVTQTVMERLTRYEWTGNIRELQNVLERAVVLSTGDTLLIGENTVPAASMAAGPSNRSLEEIERSHILEALRKTNWVINGSSGAAERLGLNPNTLRSRLKKMGIKRPFPT